MSEFINNSSKRKEILKSVLKQLHEGKSVDEVKAEFSLMAQSASSAEIAEVEQMLIEEGLPVEEVQRLCDVHVAVFRESLDKEHTPDSLPGHPVFTFKSENQVVSRVLNEMRMTVEKLQSKPDPAIRQVLTGLLERLKEFPRHYLRKENLLFPYMEKYGFTGPSKVMWGIHDEIRGQMKELGRMLAIGSSAEQIAEAFSKMETAITEMVYKEEKILFPASLEHLHEEDWGAIRQQEDEIGYFIVTPGNQWQYKAEQVEEPTVDTARPLTAGELPLDTGALTLEQINLLLTNLPVDVTFVDENDEVKYFSQGKERIFPRSPAIIGRKVQNCHPAQSVHRVMQIVDDFRAGRNSMAEFWIQMGGKFIHIRYFALRDEKNAYRGTLEVSQEITGIRALEGEKRLMD
jgi:uncharacterized protein